MNIIGILFGLMALILIGLGFPLVIYGERYLGYLWWPYMLGVGIVLMAASLLLSNEWLSATTGVLGAIAAWGSTELKEQAVRAEIGWYPFNARKLTPPFENVIKKWKAPHL